MKLLIVDDMKSFLDLEKTFLVRADCRVYTATTGLEAIKVAQQERPDLILLDVEMPEMNGIEATRIIGQQPDLKDIPIVVLSSTDRVAEAISAGAREFVKKPVDEERFLEVIQRYVPLKIRQDPRRELNRPCTYESDGTKGEGIVADLSISGLFLQAPHPFAIGDRLGIRFFFPVEESEKEVNAEGMIVRVSHQGFGIRFTDISEGAKLFISDFAGH